ncbi:MAG TPA: DUF4136 domain-containing protein [bacterium]|nr:DUF4136 domain-containing protein [bacterium]
MKRLTAAALTVLFWASCSSIHVSVQYDEEVDFRQYRTFRFERPRARTAARKPAENPLFTKEVMSEIRPILESRGFHETDPGEEPDFLVVFYALVRNRRDWVAPTYRVGRWGRVHRTSPGHVVHYKEGTLVIDIVDSRKKELIWQGIGKGLLDRNQPAGSLVNAVRKVLEGFPPER